VLLSDGYHNSLAASFEIASFLEQRGVEHKLINLPLEDDAEGGCLKGGPCELRETTPVSPYDIPAVMEALAAQRIGLIGGASSWLISSGIDRAAVTAKFGAQFIDIPISELESEYVATPAEGIDEASQTYSREALADAERMYRALKAICVRHNLTALTIKCFDLLDSCKTTSCLALARLSDEGIISGCEGDIPSLWTLIVANAFTGHPAFMANPSSSNPAAGTVDFAHCTIPLSMCKSYTLPSHFESGIGIGIAGILPEGPCKILKIGGPQLDRIYQAEGTIVCNTRIPERCRTQIRFRFPSPAAFDRFMTNRLGNHVILYR
jgi:L-fucose isomerase-like protein